MSKRWWCRKQEKREGKLLEGGGGEAEGGGWTRLRLGLEDEEVSVEGDGWVNVDNMILASMGLVHPWPEKFEKKVSGWQSILTQSCCFPLVLVMWMLLTRASILCLDDAKDETLVRGCNERRGEVNSLLNEEGTW